MAEIGELAACFSNNDRSIDLNLGIFTGLDSTNKARILDDKGEHIKGLVGDVMFVGNNVVLTLKTSWLNGSFNFPSTSFIVCEITNIEKEMVKPSPVKKTNRPHFKILPVVKPTTDNQKQTEKIVLTLKIKKGIGATKDVFQPIEGREIKIVAYGKDRWMPLCFEIQNINDVFKQFSTASGVSSLLSNYNPVAKLSVIPKESDWVYYFTHAGKLRTMYECGSVFIERSKRTDSCSLKVFSKDIHNEGKSFTIQPGRAINTWSVGLSFALPYRLDTNFHKEILTMDKLEY